ncbi:MAG TPA: hypothetical protein VKD22_05155, partial [Ramlibacter sp.]|nr:hypothetical protein [Ramlibacter sp.]
MAQTGLQLAGTQFGRIYGRHTDDSLGLSSNPADAARNTAKVAALPASATLVLQSGAWPFAAGTVACRVKPEPGALVRPTGALTISGPVEACAHRWIDESLGG